MSAKFIEFAVNRLIEDAKNSRTTEMLKQILQDETADQIKDRVLMNVDGLAMAYITEKCETLFIFDFQECAQKIVEELKKRLLV